MPTGYSWLDLDTALAQLAQRLNDPTFTFWSQAELTIYIQQSLRLYNSLTFQQKTNFTYNSSSLWNSLGSLAGSPRLRTLTSDYAFTQLQYMLLEPPSAGGTWTGTTQFNLADITQALQTRRDEMLQISNCNLSLMAGVPFTPNTRRTFIPDTVIDIPRVRYITTPNIVLSSALEQDQSNAVTPQQGSFSGISTIPSGMFGSSNAGDVFDSFSVVQPDAKLFLSFYGSSGLISSIDLSTVGSSVTAPTGTTSFTVTANNATVGGNYDFNFNVNGLSYSFFVGPSSGNYETDISGANDNAAINVYPLVQASPQSIVAITALTDPDNPYKIVFLDANLNVLSAAAASLTSFTAPALSVFTSLQLASTSVPNTASSVTYTIQYATVVGGSSTAVTLYRDDTVALEFYESPLYQLAPGTPQTYQMSSEPPLSFDVDIVPDQPGTYELIVLQSGTPLAPPTSTLLGIPDDFVWVLIWGALADLLGRESEATDRQRAAYALKRYQDGLVLLQKTPWIMLGSVNGVACSTDSIFSTDRYMPEWDYTPATFGPCIVTGGIDFLAAPINSGVGLTVLGNMPVPSAGGDFLQVSRSDFDIILDLAQALASFKLGGAEFEQALELEKRAIQACAAENSRLRSFGAFSDILVQRGQDQERNLNRYNAKRSK